MTTLKTEPFRDEVFARVERELRDRGSVPAVSEFRRKGKAVKKTLDGKWGLACLVATSYDKPEGKERKCNFALSKEQKDGLESCTRSAWVAWGYGPTDDVILIPWKIYFTWLPLMTPSCVKDSRMIQWSAYVDTKRKSGIRQYTLRSSWYKTEVEMPEDFVFPIKS